jgi:four helix bundle protein
MLDATGAGFDHERLEVYQLALELIPLAETLVSQLPPGRAYLVDQLRRAALSVVLNIAEGSGEFSARDKARFYRMARRSATECASILDVFRTSRLGDGETCRVGRRLLLRVVSMLVQLGRRWERKEVGSAGPTNVTACASAPGGPRRARSGPG